MKVIYKNEKTYLPYDYKGKEFELENNIIKNSKLIFGQNSVFLEKSSIKTWENRSIVPDGFVISLKERKWYIIEVELHNHSFHNHILPQLLGFVGAIKKPQNKELVRKYFYYKIRKNPETIELFENLFPNEEIHYILTKIIENIPGIILIIDNEKELLQEQTLKDFIKSQNIPEFKVLEFNSYFCKVNGKFDYIYFFDVLEMPNIKNDKKPPLKDTEIASLKKELEVYKGSDELISSFFEEMTMAERRDGLNQILAVLLGIYCGKMTFKDSSRKVAKFLKITRGTVTNKFYRTPFPRRCLGKDKININEVQALINSPNDFRRTLIGGFPERKDSIENWFNKFEKC